jgi:hypothetical protein
MISEKQLAANRENAQKSTGPKTPRGKAIVARNAVKHGIFSQDIVPVGGDREGAAYARMLAGLRDSLKPEGQMEHSLVEKIAVDTWRLRRTVAYEAAAVRQEVEKLKDNMESWHGLRKPECGGSDREESTPLEFLKYTDEVTDADIQDQLALLARLSDPRHPLEGDDRALAFVYRTRVDEDRQRRSKEWKGINSLQPVVKLDKPLPLDWREQAKAYLARLNAAHQGRVRSELLQHEEQVLEEMKAVADVRTMIAEHTPLHSMPPDEQVEKIVRYETMLERNIKRNVDMLHKLQASRRSLSQK